MNSRENRRRLLMGCVADKVNRFFPERGAGITANRKQNIHSADTFQFYVLMRSPPSAQFDAIFFTGRVDIPGKKDYIK